MFVVSSMWFVDPLVVDTEHGRQQQVESMGLSAIRTVWDCMLRWKQKHQIQSSKCYILDFNSKHFSSFFYRSNMI